MANVEIPALQPSYAPMVQGANSLFGGLMQGYQMQRQLAMMQMEREFKQSEIDKNNMLNRIYAGKVVPSMTTPDGVVLPGGQQGQSPLSGILGGSQTDKVGRPVIKDAHGNPVDTSNFSANDYNKLQAQLASGAQSGQFGLQRAQTMANALGARTTVQATENGLTGPEKVKLDSTANASPLLRGAIDTYNAYRASTSGGDPNSIATSFRKSMASNPMLSGLVQTNGIDPNNYAAIHGTIMNQLAQENPKMMNGSSANPTPDEMKNYLATAPNLNDQPQQYLQKARTIFDSGIQGAYKGAENQLSRGKNADGSFVNPAFGNLYRNAQQQHQQAMSMFPEFQGPSMTQGAPASGGQASDPEYQEFLQLQQQRGQ